MKKKLTTLFLLLCSLIVSGQPMAGTRSRRHVHHTQRLPGVNERRLARLEKMREANLALRHRQGPWRVNTRQEAKRGLVLLVEFSDEKMKSNAAVQWGNRFNQSGFSLNNHIGSVRDYFMEQSYGQLSIDFDVIGPLPLPNTRSYYGTAPNSQLDDRAAEMVIEALKIADPQVNYADYDWDGDDEVDQVYVIYAGQTYYDKPGYIWPHEWFLSAAKMYGNGTGWQQMDNVYIDTYAVSNELDGPSLLAGIGTACHEFSHCLGFPDFYDTSYSGGTGGQNWDLLDGGCYNGPRRIGEVPSPYTAYERWMAGWIDLTPLTEPCRVKGMPAINEEGVAYILRNSGNNNEYYILENRQQTGFGKGNLGHGLMVWHIDYNRSVWENNNVNSDINHQRMTFLPADGKVGELDGNDQDGYMYSVSADDEAGDPYPGRQGIAEVQPLTWFTAERYGTKAHANLIHDITETTDGKISFVYGDYVPLATPEPASPTDISVDSFTANWTPVEGATGYTLQVKVMTNEAAPATILEEDFSGFSEVSRNSSVGSSIIDRFTQTPGWTLQFLYGTREASVRIGSVASSGFLTTPALANMEGTLVVEFDASYYSTEESNLAVSVVDGTQTLATQTVQLTATQATYKCTFENIPKGCSVSFQTTSAKRRVLLYNVKIMDMSGRASDVTTLADLTTTNYVVAPIVSDTYSYRVQAVCDDGTSLWSDWLDVDLSDLIDGMPEPSQTIEIKGEIYDLAGRRLPRIPRYGYYIRNGKTHLAR